MKRIFTLFILFKYSIVLPAQGVLPRAISKDLPQNYTVLEGNYEHNEKKVEGYATISLPQKNNCLGNSAYIFVDYTYYSKSSIPNATETADMVETFKNGAKNNHKEVHKNIPLGMLNTHDKEYLGCSELSYHNNEQIHYFHYFTKYKCRGFAEGVTSEMFEQKVTEYHYDLPENVRQQLFENYEYSDIRMRAFADKELNKKNVSITFAGSLTYEEAFYHTKQLMNYFLSFDYEKISH